MPSPNLARLNEAYPPLGRTINATPLVLQCWPPQVDEDSAGFFTAVVIGNDHGVGQTYWEFRGLFRRAVGGPLIGTAVQLAHTNTASAATWTATLAVVNGLVEVTVTGEAAKTIDWTVATIENALSMLGVFV